MESLPATSSFYPMHGHQVDANQHLAVHDYNINSISPSLYTTGGSPWSSDGEANLKDRGRPSTAPYDIEHRRVDNAGTHMQTHPSMHMLNGANPGMMGMAGLGGDPSQQAREFHHAALYGQDMRQLQQHSRQNTSGAIYDNRPRVTSDRDDEGECLETSCCFASCASRTSDPFAATRVACAHRIADQLHSRTSKVVRVCR